MELYKENGEKVGLYDVCQWWIETYPCDIFVNNPPEVVKIRELMIELKKKKITTNLFFKKI